MQPIVWSLADKLLYTRSIKITKFDWKHNIYIIILYSLWFHEISLHFNFRYEFQILVVHSTDSNIPGLCFMTIRSRIGPC